MTGSATDIQATVFDIQSFSLNDGPGIRTVVFFKGCPLHCRWCHNPESLSKTSQLMFHKTLCVGCLQCVAACPNGVHRAVLEDGRYQHVVRLESCTGCGFCLQVCCYDALTLVGRKYTPAGLLERIRGDFRYFNVETGDNGRKGGITFSGGEPMLYADFIVEFRNLMPEIHCAMETSGFATREVVSRIAPLIDLFLFDYKVTDPARHRELCGVDNVQILENLDYLYGIGKEIVLRLPLIPGVNDTADHFDGIAGLLKKYPGIKQAEIMPYHTYGLGKSEELGKEADPLLPKSAATDATVACWLAELRDRGCTNVYQS